MISVWEEINVYTNLFSRATELDQSITFPPEVRPERSMLETSI